MSAASTALSATPIGRGVAKLSRSALMTALRRPKRQRLGHSPGQGFLKESPGLNRGLNSIHRFNSFVTTCSREPACDPQVLDVKGSRGTSLRRCRSETGGRLLRAGSLPPEGLARRTRGRDEPRARWRPRRSETRTEHCVRPRTTGRGGVEQNYGLTKPCLVRGSETFCLRQQRITTMRIERRYTTAGQSPYATLAFRLATSEIRNPDGSVVFKLDGIEVPEAWSQVACDVLAQKYFRKAGVPARLKKVEENDVPSWLWRSVPDEAALAELPEDERSGSEISLASRSSTGSPAAGPIGAGRAAISPPRRTRRPSSTSCASCSPTRWWRRTRRNGSTPACTGPTASTGRARAISTSTTRPAS